MSLAEKCEESPEEQDATINGNAKNPNLKLSFFIVNPLKSI